MLVFALKKLKFGEPLSASYSDPSSLNAYSIRVDQAVNLKTNLFGRYSYSPSNLDQRGAFSAPYAVLSTTDSESASIHTFKLGLNQVITPTLSNEVRANYSNNRITTKYFLDNFGGPVPLTRRKRLESSLGSGGANGGLNALYRVGGPRSIQLALKLQF